MSGDTPRFLLERQGQIDVSSNYYATNTIITKERCVLLGWVRRFDSGLAWNGVLALPRDLWVDPSGHLRQSPIPELEKLRCRRMDGGMQGTLPGTRWEMLAVVRTRPGESACWRWGDADFANLYWQDKMLKFQEIGVYLSEEVTEIHAFFDRSVLEVFVNQRHAITLVLKHGQTQPVSYQLQGLELVAPLQIWELVSCLCQ